ncbi:MAG: ROK family transcriptional regulator [Caldilineaceae bacterium]|nr:ROK family transcriptional regulator [Caldilineaceae bacterium]
MMSSSQQVRLRNRANVLHALRRRPGLSKIALARQLRISPATVGSIIAGLTEEGLVVSIGAGPSTGGRPAEHLELNRAGPVAVGVDLGQTMVRIGILNLAGKLLAQRSVPFQRHHNEVDLAAIVTQVEEMVGTFPHGTICGIGVAVPGLLDLERGMVRYAANLGWRNLMLRDAFAQVFGQPIVMIRNTNAALLAEDWWGNVVTRDPSIFVTLGSGIGAALRVDRHFIQGAAAVAGELGHIPIDPSGMRCSCGQRGCLEAMASGRAVQERYNRLRSRRMAVPNAAPLSLSEILQQAMEGEELARTVLEEAAYYLGIGLTILTNLLNPAVIVLGGELMEASDLLLRPIVQYIHTHALSDAAAAVTVVASTFRSDAALIGAASLVFDELFQGRIPVGEEVTAMT